MRLFTGLRKGLPRWLTDHRILFERNHVQAFFLSQRAAVVLEASYPKLTRLNIEVGKMPLHACSDYWRGLGFQPTSAELRLEGSLAYLRFRGTATVLVPLPYGEAKRLLTQSEETAEICRSLLHVGEGLLLERRAGEERVKALSKCSTAQLLALAAE